MSQYDIDNALQELHACVENLKKELERSHREAQIRQLVNINMIRYTVQGMRRADVAIAIEEVEPDYASSSVDDVLNSPPIEPDFSVFRFFMEPSETILDVGANIGLAAASIFNSGCRASVVSFEPNPWHHPALMRIKQRMPERFDFLPIGVGDSDGSLSFVTPVIEGRAISTLSTANIISELDWAIPENLIIHCMDVIPQIPKPRIQFTESQWTVETLDGALARARLNVSLDRIAAIKFDVEGYEAKAIAGARKVLAQHRPLIMVEGANRSLEVCKTLDESIYFYADYREGHLVRTDMQSPRVNGFFVHRDRTAEYVGMGLLALS